MYKAAGSQCAYNVCLSFIMDLTTKPIPSWESSDMNTILREGDNLHIDLQKGIYLNRILYDRLTAQRRDNTTINGGIFWKSPV